MTFSQLFNTYLSFKYGRNTILSVVLNYHKFSLYLFRSILIVFFYLLTSKTILESHSSTIWNFLLLCSLNSFQLILYLLDHLNLPQLQTFHWVEWLCANNEHIKFALVNKLSYCYGVGKMVMMRKKYVNTKTLYILFSLIHIWRGPFMHRRL